MSLLFFNMASRESCCFSVILKMTGRLDDDVISSTFCRWEAY